MEASRKAGEDASYPIGRERIEIEELQVRRALRSLDKRSAQTQLYKVDDRTGIIGKTLKKRHTAKSIQSLTGVQ